MKALARSYFWWPGMDTEIETHVRACDSCQQLSKVPARAPLHPWEWPGRPWYRLHIDFAGPFEGKMILVIVDAHTKYIDAHLMSSTTAAATILKLRRVFATHGLPHMLVSDNGTSFTSAEFQQFCRTNGIKHVTTSAYHPSSNGLAERAVQTMKNGLKKCNQGNLEERLCRVLMRYRLIPQSTTGHAPAEMLLRRRPRSRLDFIFPSVAEDVCARQASFVVDKLPLVGLRRFHTGDPVYVLNHAGGPKWMPGVITQQTGPVTFLVDLQDGRVW